MVDAETISSCGKRLSLDKIKSFEVSPDDVFLITYPKSGTTWMKEIVPFILNGGNIDEIKDTPADVRVPYLEFALSSDDDERVKQIQSNFNVPKGFSLDDLKPPRTICTHLRREFLPRGIEEKRAKVIYVARNPKDIAVSTYYFSKMLMEKGLGCRSSEPYGDFNDLLHDFLEAEYRTQTVVYDGSKWHEHVLEWWNRRHEGNVLFLKYEDMLQDIKASLRQISEFLSAELSTSAVEKISNHCSFKTMKKNRVALKGDYCEKILGGKSEETSPFVRKGGAGGWKNYFTVAQNEMFDRHYREWMKDSDLEMTFEL
ncbi:sulfotransferase 1A1-like isoform X2 [Ptychodera flava]|uniref:sulfotransferase 1A1-like isoform X2 n=1 Tax=Ptychodera flava TaxID=63121 RepID=UPI00396AAFBD